MVSPAGEENDDMVTPNGAAPSSRRLSLPTRALSGLLIGGILAIGAASVWYMLGHTDLPGLIADSDDAWAGMTTDEYLAALRERQPIIRSDFDVYLVEHRRYESLIYVKEQCTWAEVDATFFVHVVPASPDVLSDHRKPHGFDNLDFEFERHGARHGETCWADLPLPGYEIAAIRTGQYVEDEDGYREIWKGEVLFQVDGIPVDEYLASLGERQPAIRSDFDVHLVEDRLIYVKEQCTRADVDAMFFVHVVPVSSDALPAHRRPHGIDNLDFGFERHGARHGETCWAALPLPGYEIAAIRTGQSVKEESGHRILWEGRVSLALAGNPGGRPSGGIEDNSEGRVRLDSQVDETPADEYPAALGEHQPAIRSDFDVHLVEDRLIYVKEQCTRADVDAGFFVHVVPASPDALPAHRRPHAFDNLDFGFERHGARHGETCWAALPLPGYEIATIRTGQYVEGGDGVRSIWEGVLLFQVDGMPVDEYLAALGERQPVIRSDFDVYLVEDRLIYVKEQCTWADVDAMFFVHVVPASPDVLPDHRKPHGFDSLDFGFERHGARHGETCWAALSLPSYEIAAIKTGQAVKEEGGYRKIWKGRFLLE